MFQFSPSLEFRIPHPRVQTALYDALESMRIADVKLEKAIEDFEGASEPKRQFVGERDLLDAQVGVRHFAICFQEIISGVMPSIPDHAFHELAEFVNRHEANAPHFEGVVLALHLACRSLERAMDLSGQLDGEEMDPAFELMMAARSFVSFHAGLLESLTAGFVGDNVDQILDAIISRRPAPSPEQLHLRWLDRWPAQRVAM